VSASSSIGFTAGGIDVNFIVQGLMQAERQPITALQTKVAKIKLQSDAVSRMRTSLDSLRLTASNLLTSGITRLSSASSNASAATATLSSQATAGSVSFTVDQLARAEGLRTAGTVGSSSAVVTTASTFAIASTASQIGFGRIVADPSIVAGRYTLEVTQASAGATKTGTSALATSTAINGSNNTLTFDVGGAARSVTIADGTYSSSELVTAVQAGIDAAGGGARATLDGAGRLRLTSTDEGSLASLQVTGGSALTPLGLTTDATAIAGIDGRVRVGTGAETTVTSTASGATAVVAAGAGNLTLDITGPLRVGSSQVAVVSTGDRSLAAVASAINGANIGASAAAVRIADGQWILQVNAANTGLGNRLSLDQDVFAGIGGLTTTSTAQDARISIGSGPGAYSISSNTNSFSNVMPGVTINVAQTTTQPVTLSVSRDDNATSDAVKRLVDQATALIADINLQTKYDPKTKIAGPLAGDATIRRFAEEIRATVTEVVAGSSLTSAGNVGITVNRDGTFKFDSAKFRAALSADPAAVERIFARGGSSTGGASFFAAADVTQSGSYAVDVTTAATRATTGDILVGGSPGGQTIGVRVGATTATFAAQAGASAADIVAGLNDAMAAAGLRINAELSGGGVRLTAVEYGSAPSFDTNLDVTGAGTWGANSGTDVAGTIAGLAAQGAGNRLRLLTTDESPAKGLEVTVGEGLTGSLGPVSYDPGVAARLVRLGTAAISTGGTLVTSANTYDTRTTTYNQQIDRFEARMVVKERQLRRQWTSVQTLLSNLQTQQSWLAQQVSGLQARNG
jgi:flagellar hook-associated protein 2